ncbi:phosphoribosylglycinamide formyltransferase [Leeuwenhoekiella parthenopeia]|uniref:Phosphoribosylglycinamide formyltransferase n=1 Tax=Leeuwenhoekiella parthenopeia TaxID=2890320 RepID=A0ABS8GQT8_9FLAO|nr:phosphoribosylglycinamide formyltransferase [Leeuwenhoekiella parthenopeia]MCC4211873.1 phosphoribosylglycinamide formyltransferase [Leeuwenhoekiella parthenopeia]
MKHIVIFASGSGTNAQRIIEYFNDRDDAQVVLVLSNKPTAQVLQRAGKLKVSAFSFNRTAFYESDQVLNLLEQNRPDLIVLAGFLWLMPKKIIATFSGKILNIHPALLPAYGGKGMYGSHVHEAVVAAGEKESGITIHEVTEEYDKGSILFQAKTQLTPNETPESLAAKIHELEYEHFPQVIETFLNKK